MLCKIQSFLIESQHCYSNRIIYLLVMYSVKKHRLKKMNDTNVAIQKANIPL